MTPRPAIFPDDGVGVLLHAGYQDIHNRIEGRPVHIGLHLVAFNDGTSRYCLTTSAGGNAREALVSLLKLTGQG